ncbi:hypothetical protein FHETE_7959 [Fusarium heterosporum]|uniref:Zn(2)-C6 fungal-type domain-containing protein n=1 Tax=Fusarium heterosporum TaxID=42747 RepID=A0A8H5T424_FUSHE|nr:hypothetical protein FHETE_7959 [Fusarium heterosporum]
MTEAVIRKACDRCHAQKLSCKRYNDEACERCVRLKTECKSSPSLRYRKTQQQLVEASSSGSSSQQQQINSAPSGRRSPKRRRTDSQGDPSLVSPDTGTCPLFIVYSLVLVLALLSCLGSPPTRTHYRDPVPVPIVPHTKSLTSENHLAPVSPDPVVDGSDFAFTFDQQLAFFTGPQYLSHTEFPGNHQRSVFWEPAALFQPEAYPHPPPHQQQAPEVVPEGDVPLHQQQQQQHAVPLNNTSCAPEHSSFSDKRASHPRSKRRPRPRPRQITLRHDADLSPLQELEAPSIHWMAQLSDINARLLDLTSVLPSPQDGPLIGRPVDERFRSRGFPIEDMFKLTRRVADILEKPPSSNDSTKKHHSAIDGSDPGNAMFILSTYVRLLDMYQRVFSLVHTELVSQTDSSATFSFWKLPDVTVGSFAVESSPFLQMSLTIQLAEEFLSRLRGSTARWSGAGNAASMFAGVVDVSFQAFRDREEALAKHLVELRSEIEPLIDS